MGISYFLLLRELDQWRALGKTPQIWWRDDDARTVSPQLDRLLHVRGGLPISLAVIPAGDLRQLANALHSAAQVTISQHGVDHVNRLPDETRRSEYLDGATDEDVVASVRSGRSRLERAGLAPAFYTPPWNTYDARLLEALKAAGYTAYSAGIYGRATAGMDHIGAEVDILRWKNAPRFRGRRRVFNALRRQLHRRRSAGLFEEPVGLLTHHLVHDEPAWRFLEWFASFSCQRFIWRSFPQLAAARGRL